MRRRSCVRYNTRSELLLGARLEPLQHLDDRAARWALRRAVGRDELCTGLDGQPAHDREHATARSVAAGAASTGLGPAAVELPISIRAGRQHVSAAPSRLQLVVRIRQSSQTA